MNLNHFFQCARANEIKKHIFSVIIKYHAMFGGKQSVTPDKETVTFSLEFF
jgi:hypothetical protein